jgi:hypothetical protein
MNRDGSPVKKLGIIDFQDGCHCVRSRVRWGSALRSFACSALRSFACSGLRSALRVCL